MKHLLSISIGPVQEFIAAARRTSDLTAGSEMLVEIARAATGKAAEHAVDRRPIMPADIKTDGPNKILVELEVGSDPRAVAEEAKGAARECLRNMWSDVRGKLNSRYEIDDDLANAQIGRFLEIYAAWAPITGTYGESRGQVDRLLAARKALRDFEPAPQGIAPPPIRAKSPLDPAFECVLKAVPDEDDEKGDDGSLRLKQTEFLDAISVLKRRRGLEMKQVPSTRVLARRNWQPNTPADADLDAEKGGEKEEKHPYFAVLVADGDEMGKRIGEQDSAEAHRKFSGKLAKFARDAGGVVKARYGYQVYAGGDDVLAFLPANTAVQCARDLAGMFREVVGATLSAGVAIAHHRQPLSISVQQAREAEKMAKKARRDSLCLAIHTRGGNPLHITRKWDDWKDFDIWTGAFDGDALARGVAYELKSLGREFEGLDVPPDLLRLEVDRIWKRKEAKNKADRPSLPDAVQFNRPAELREFADMLIAARFLTAKEG